MFFTCLSVHGRREVVWCHLLLWTSSPTPRQHLPPPPPPRQRLPQTASPPDSTSPWRAPPLPLLRWKSGYYASYWNAILLYFYQNLCRISADRAVRVMFGTEVPKEQYVPVHRIVWNLFSLLEFFIPDIFNRNGTKLCLVMISLPSRIET